MNIVVGSGNARRVAELPCWAAKTERENRERLMEDTKALVTRPQTFKNFSGRLA